MNIIRGFFPNVKEFFSIKKKRFPLTYPLDGTSLVTHMHSKQKLVFHIKTLITTKNSYGELIVITLTCNNLTFTHIHVHKHHKNSPNILKNSKKQQTAPS